MKSGAWWPIAIIGVLSVTVAANVAVLVAARDPSGSAVESDYYRKAVAWDSTQAQDGEDRRLGWRADAAIGQRGTGGLSPVTLTLADSAGDPLDGGRVELVAIHNLDADHPVHAAMAGAGAGRYAAALPLRYPGLWELRISAELGGRRFTSTLRRDTPAPERP